MLDFWDMFQYLTPTVQETIAKLGMGLRCSTAAKMHAADLGLILALNMPHESIQDWSLSTDSGMTPAYYWVWPQNKLPPESKNCCSYIKLKSSVQQKMI